MTLQLPNVDDQRTRLLPIAAGVTLQPNSFAFIDASGYLTNALTAKFAGVVRSRNPTDSGKWDNSAGANGDLTATVYTRCDAPWLLACSQADVGAVVYASGDKTATLTAGSNTAVGKLIGIQESGIGAVAIRGIGE